VDVVEAAESIAMSPLVTVSNLAFQFNCFHALRGVSFEHRAGSARALVGTNCAGKSTTLLAIAGALERGAERGSRIDVAPGNDVSLVPERDKVFTLLTVTENLAVADRQRGRGKVVIDDIFGWFPRLAERRGWTAGNLSGGEQQMLAIGMALVGSPSVLLFDEPTLGLAVPIIERTCETLTRLRRELNLTILCAEAEPQWIDQLADRALVIARGEIVSVIDENLTERKDEMRDLSLGLSAGTSV
jgi:branched-chain amino acid transport system ATP-binding protein